MSDVTAQIAPKKRESFTATPNAQLNAHPTGPFPQPPNLSQSSHATTEGTTTLQGQTVSRDIVLSLLVCAF